MEIFRFKIFFASFLFMYPIYTLSLLVRAAAVLDNLNFILFVLIELVWNGNFLLN